MTRKMSDEEQIHAVGIGGGLTREQADKLELRLARWALQQTTAERDELLAALKAALDWHDGKRNDGEWVGMARGAVANAEGK